MGGRLVVHQLGGADDVDEDDGGSGGLRRLAVVVHARRRRRLRVRRGGRKRTRSRSRRPLTIALKPRAHRVRCRRAPPGPSQIPCSTRLSQRAPLAPARRQPNRIHITKPEDQRGYRQDNTFDASCVSRSGIAPMGRRAVVAIPVTGTPEPSDHTVIVRPMMPSANRRGGRPASSALAAAGASANSVNK